MNALEKIISQIDLSAEKELEKLKSEHDDECKKIFSKYDDLLKNYRNKTEQKITEFKRDLNVKIDAENLIFKKKMVLQKKQNVISEVIELAFDVLINQKECDDKYFKLIEGLIEKNLPGNGKVCELIYGGFDYDRFLKGLKFRSTEFLKIKKSDKFDYGAKIVCSCFEVDLSLKKLFFSWCNSCRPTILKVLQFGEF